MNNKFGLRKFKKDPRRFSYKAKFGAAPLLGEDFELPARRITSQIEDMCSAHAIAALREDTEGVDISPEWQFKMTKQIEGRWDSYGGDIDDALAAARKGALEQELATYHIGKNTRNEIANWNIWPAYLDEVAKIHKAKSSFKCDSQADLFDSIRDVILNQKRAVVVGAYWQPYWSMQGGMVPDDGPYNKVNPHAFVIRGQKNLDQLRLKAQNSWGTGQGDGGYFYFTRNQVNRFLFAFAILDADPEETKRETWGILARMYDAVLKLLQLLTTRPAPTPVAPSPVPPVEPLPVENIEIPTPQPPVQPGYLWDTPENARHSIRVICDESGLTVEQKNLICSIISCESGYKPNATHKNNNGTTDWGICQFNDGPLLAKPSGKWWIGPNKTLESTDEALNNPEKCVRAMIRQLKVGGLKNWVCYSSGLYSKYQ